MSTHQVFILINIRSAGIRVKRSTVLIDTHAAQDKLNELIPSEIVKLHIMSCMHVNENSLKLAVYMFI